MSYENMSALAEMWIACVKDGYVLDEGQDYESMSIDAGRIIFDGARGVLPNVPGRKLNVAYAIREFLWYCRADRQDHSICEHAQIWKKMIQADNGINSNYGQYIFQPYIAGRYGRADGLPKSSQFMHCVEELSANPDSRRACMVLLKQEHLYQTNTDMVCTFGLTFHIRDNMLNMHVMMRSNDAVWGLTNDAFCFSMIQRMLCAQLRSVYSDLQVGRYVHDSASLHVYKRHYASVQLCVDQLNRSLYEEINPPMIDENDLEAILYADSNGGAFMTWANSILE